MRLAIGGALLPLALLAAGAAHAAGGAHVIDDAAVETPGTCHLESWVTRSSGDSGLIYAAPACTRTVWPNIELGGFVAHASGQGAHDTAIGLSPKLMLRSADHGIGIAVATSAGYSIDRRRFETASLIVPVTIPVGDLLRFNLDAGWLWTRAGHRNDMFVGAQAEIAVRRTLNLMVETFTRDEGRPGGQTGLRWTVADGSVDLDLIGGRYVDGATRNSITFGVTIRR